MDTPCIVCQENCPVSPKAIKTREIFHTLDTGAKLIVEKANDYYIEFKTGALTPEKFATGDYYANIADIAVYFILLMALLAMLSLAAKKLVAVKS